MIIDTDDISWNTRAMAMPDYQDGIAPSTASPIVREFGECPECGADVDPEVADALYQDRDVMWENDRNHKSSPHVCPECETEVRIFVEEKAFGIIGESQLPSDADTCENVYFIPVKDSSNYLVINTHQFCLTEATPRKSQSQAVN
ncbi:hypothetical protein [Haloarcula sp. H-GB5]